MFSLDESIELESFALWLKRLLDKEGIEIGENSILIDISCSDDQCTTVLEEIKRVLRKSNNKEDVVESDEIYERRVFGGIFLPDFHTYESLMPAAHHIPDKGRVKKLVVLHLSHIGYDPRLGYGYFIRYGHKKPTTACGAIKALYESKEYPKDIDLRYLKKFIEYVRDEGDSLETITYKLLHSSSSYLLNELHKLSQHDEVEIIYVSGIEIDMSKSEGTYYNDRIYVDGIWKITPHTINTLELEVLNDEGHKTYENGAVELKEKA